MKQLTGAQIRQMYLDFFKEKGHAVEPSAPLVPMMIHLYYGLIVV